MKKELRMSQGNLDNIAGRLVCFKALLDTIRDAMDENDKLAASMFSASDLLDCICRDFQADIDCAEAYEERRATA